MSLDAVPNLLTADFQSLTGNRPFPWQCRLYDLFASGDFAHAQSCNLPTGLGKTSVIPIWLLALVAAPNRVPRRLVYVVNRRTVVDQATREAEKIRERLPAVPRVVEALKKLCACAVDKPDQSLAISTLRGQFADNAEWRADPARPAVVVGTVDMIGSRLLFSGYGCGFKSRPLHAGFLAQDVLLVHDEAHLEPAFQDLLSAIVKEQRRGKEQGRFHVMELTATSRSTGDQFGLTDEDRTHPIVRQRITAKKGIAFHPIADEKKTADHVAELALAHKDSGQAILVFLRKLEDVGKVVEKLGKAKHPPVQLTGTLRGKERDELVSDPAFQRFLPPSDRLGQAVAGTVYLVCTSAGEVGVNISADHLVCDLTSFDSMAQRFGRVNRFGDGDARIDVVHPESFGDESLETRRKNTLDLLHSLPTRDGRHDASPAALSELVKRTPETVRLEDVYYTPRPATVPVGDILFDAWALTTIREPLPGRPPVADWLHGVSELDPPETEVAWRDEVELLTDRVRSGLVLEDLLDDYPLKPHELLRDRTFRVIRNLDLIAERAPELSAWVVQPDGKVIVRKLPELVQTDKQKKPLVPLAGRTVLLPPAAGGLSGGMLDGDSPYAEERRELYDVAGAWRDENREPRRCRIWDGEDEPEDMRLVRNIDTKPETDDEEADEIVSRRVWRWFVRPKAAEEGGGPSAPEEQDLIPHLVDAERYASELADRLLSDKDLRVAVRLAAKWHDLGKRRDLWQRNMGNTKYPDKVIAKTGHRKPPREWIRYRHEFGSLLDLLDERQEHKRAFEASPESVRDLILHLIAAHHGRGRPHFTSPETFDSEHTEARCAEVAREVPLRFARLQRAYGRWGLAFLESLVRAADVLASQPGKGKS